jgi:elongation factor Ts
MHVAAANPQYVKREEVPSEALEAEREIFRGQAKELKKPEKVIEKIVEGKIDKYLSEICLLDQAFVKDPDKTVKDVLTELIAKLGENMSIRRFARFQLGETKEGA